MGIAVLVVGLMGLPLSGQGGVALGSPCSEAGRHLWSLAVAADQWQVGEVPRRVAAVGWPVGLDAPLLDPVNVLVFAPLQAIFGSVWAWNLLVLSMPLVLGLGCWKLARALRMSVLGGATLAVAAVGAPWLLQFGATGRSEYLPAALWPLWLACMVDARRGAVGAAVAGALCLGLMLSGGPIITVFWAALSLPVLGLWLWRKPHREGALPLLSVVLGLVLALPALLPVLRALPQRAAGAMDGAGPGLVAPVQTSLATLFRWVPEALQPPTEQPATVALVLLVLGMVGAWHHRHARGWWLLGLWGLFLAQGTAPTAAVDVHAAPAVVQGPLAWLAQVVPPLSAISSWSRLGCLLGVSFGVAAALAVDRVRGRWRWAVVALLGVALVDQSTNPRGIPRTDGAFSVSPPVAYLDALGSVDAGPVMQLPMELPGPGACTGRGRWLLWSLAHDRPVTSTPAEVADTGVTMGFVGEMMRRVQDGRVRGPGAQDADAHDCLRESAQRLHSQGLAAVVVDTADPRGRDQAAWLSAAWGPPVHTGRFQGWSLGGVPPPSRLVPVCRPPR